MSRYAHSVVLDRGFHFGRLCQSSGDSSNISAGATEDKSASRTYLEASILNYTAVIISVSSVGSPRRVFLGIAAVIPVPGPRQAGTAPQPAAEPPQPVMSRTVEVSFEILHICAWLPLDRSHPLFRADRSILCVEGL